MRSLCVLIHSFHILRQKREIYCIISFSPKRAASKRFDFEGSSKTTCVLLWSWEILQKRIKHFRWFACLDYSRQNRWSKEKKENANNPNLLKITVLKFYWLWMSKSDKYSQFAGRMRLNRAITVMYLIKKINTSKLSTKRLLRKNK